MANKITIQYYDHKPSQKRFIEIDDRNWEFIKSVIKLGAKMHKIYNVDFKETV